MRKIGAISDRHQGAVLGAYLFSQGIENDIDPGSDGSCVVWIHSDDKLDVASEILSHFQANATDARYTAGAREGEKQLAEETAKDERFRKNYHDRKRLFKKMKIGLVTAGLVGLSVVITVLSEFGRNESVTGHVLFTAVQYGNRFALPEIASGQVWRLVLPIFLHWNFLHLLFNMMWTVDLGTVLERRHGSVVLLIFVVVIGVVSNMLQFLVSGPYFGGMSGVVYGFLGYLWIRSKTDPFYDIHLNKNTVMMMGIWFVLCIVLTHSQMGMHIANMAHGGGLAVGMLAGYVSGLIAKRSRFGKTK